jgi:small subunit ribosomal protein S17
MAKQASNDKKKAGKPAEAKPAKVEAVKAEIAPATPAPAATPAAPKGDGKNTTHSFRRKLVGRVTSDKMNKTVVVEVSRYSLDRVYKKYVKQRSKYKAHDENNEYKVGDRVEIQESHPMSREKRFKVIRLVSRPVLE